MSDIYRPIHGGYPSGFVPAPAQNPLLKVMPAEMWNAIEQAAKSPDPRRANFYRAKAGYALTS